MVKANELQIIVFSFNRPWQLKEYLRTFRKYVSADIKPKVIWKASNDAFKKAYEDLFVKGWCEPISEEEHKGKFKELVLSTIDGTKSYIMFGVDDLLWYRRAWVNEYEFDVLNHAFSCSFRLAPNITFCQPANNPNKIPKLQPYQNRGYFYNRQEGWGDWDYPWEITSTLYKTNNILQLINHIDFNNPNELEAEGAKLFMGIGNTNAQINFASYKSCCSIITINRVQDQFKNELAGPEHTLEELLQLYWNNDEYDEEWYASQTFDKIHIGDFKLKSPGKRLSEMIMSGHKQGEDIIWDSLGGLEHKEGAD